ncbi:hypothetical protein F5X68DRAFT_174970 [Plectosphaerella plurivora]|uniref:Uncharacterized protein n=1 Tax=Plectosphaerella plurivora TaxID=936078 RepID=A0A9P9A516_9PEZI|nr:hypothetical protein F5X68DRAFT_174970 [Plectosphaerella plurivora]
MEPKRLSAVSALGDDAHSRRGSPSGLRALTASPRLSLMRSRRDSYDTTTSRVSSCSTESRASSSCVSRLTSPDECDRQRFIVWAAVLRNDCDKMSPSEKLECPLLRCRRRCDSHEAMLRHLYDCKLLTSGEYWCYKCERPEMFTDVNCNRCTSNPGRRRRIMSSAKSFFSSLGHKSRKEGAPSFADDVSLYDPPSLDSLDIHPQQVELSSSTEIVEIDSVELSPAHHRRVSSASNMHISADAHVQSTHTATQDFADELSRVPASTTPLPPLPRIPDQLDMWEAGLMTPEACEPARPPSPLWYQERTPLQLSTSSQQPQDQQFYPSALQNTQLSHSLSLRSNGSAATTSSNGISPASVYSAAWTMGSAWDTDVTSLSSGMVSPVGCLSRGGSNASRRSCFDPVPEENEGISELPADIPTTTSASGLSPFVNPENLGIDQMYDPLSLSTQTLSMMGQATALLDVSISEPQEHDVVEETTEDVETLATTAWKSLEFGVAEFMTKLDQLGSNPLAGQLLFLGLQGVASTGLSALSQALGGQTSLSSLEVVCFMYLADAFSTTLGHAEAGGMFDRSYLYSENIPPDERNAYLEIVNTLWPTLELHSPNPQLYGNLNLDFLPQSYDPTLANPYNLPTAFRKLTGISRRFLDELESSAVLSLDLASGATQAPLAWSRHWDDSQGNHDLGGNLTTALCDFTFHLTSQYQHSSKFTSRLGNFLNRVRQGGVPTIRKAELELIRVGKDVTAQQAASSSLKVAAKESCSLCGFRPKGHPKWFRGTMAKHMKNQHSAEPDKIFKCTFPGCKSEYRNRPDNLRQHQIEKGHMMEGDKARRPSKRKRTERSSDD